LNMWINQAGIEHLYLPVWVWYCRCKHSWTGLSSGAFRHLFRQNKALFLITGRYRCSIPA
jgi:hypothetical protein